MVSSEDTGPYLAIASADQRQRSLAGDVLRTLLRNRMAVGGAVLVALLVIIAATAPFVAPYDPLAMNPSDAYATPSRQHPMGTDEYGRDVLSRVIYGSRISVSVGIISVSISLLLGTSLGLVAGYYLGIADVVVSRMMDVVYAFPPILLALVMISLLGSGLDKVMIAIGVVYTPLFARLCRGAVLAERGKVYVEAARMVGAGNLRIIRTHIVPNVMAPVIVQASLCMSYAILTEAALSYLGLGTQPPMPSWGMMLSKGKGLLYYSPWLSIFPGLAIMAVVYAFNVFGDGLRDALDPRLRGR